MYVKCPRCGWELQSEELNIEKMYGKCRSCNTFLNLEAFEQREVVIPSDIDLDQDEEANTLTISWRWYSPKAILWGVACGLLVIAFFTEKRPLGTEWPPIVQAFATVLLAYYTLALFLNKTVISVENDRLSIGFTPLPWYGNHEYDSDQLEQFYTEEYSAGVPHDGGIIARFFCNRDHRDSYAYAVNAKFKNGKTVTLVSGLRQPEEALFIEQRIERCLGIDDRPVPGEIPH